MSTIAQVHQQKSIAFHRVLMATDFSEASERALEYAIAIAHRHGSVLTIAHALPEQPRERIPLDPLPHELDRRRLEAETQMKHLEEKPELRDLRHHTLLERGNVSDVLADEIQRDNIDLLVMGTRGRGGLRKVALGSVAEEILHLATCPMLTLGPNVRPAKPDTCEFKRILFATDFGVASNAAFPYAMSLAEAYQAKLFLLHMVPLMPVADIGPAAYGPSTYAAEQFIKWQRTMRVESLEKLKALIPPENKLAVAPEYLAGMDFLPEGILDVAGDHDIQLIVMGANRMSAPRAAAHIPWALTHELLCHAKCPVLTVCK